MSYGPYISKVTLPNGSTYDLKDAEARELIDQLAAGGLTFKVSTDAASTPYGLTWDNKGTTVTGTLVAGDGTTPSGSTNTRPYIYLVPHKVTAGTPDVVDYYREYVTVNFGTAQSPSYAWEFLGDTDINLNDLGALAWKDSVSLSKSTDSVLGADTTFTGSSSSVTFSGGSSDTFVKSYPGTSSKLETTSIKGVGSDITFNAVSADPGTVTATNTVFGTDTTASKIVTETKEATKLVLGDSTTASKATAGTAVSVAKVAGSATNISRINYGTAGAGGAYSAGSPEVINTAYVAANSETLVITSVTATQGSVTGTNGTQSITPYTFSDVTVPVVTSNTDVSIASVKTNTDVTVPVVSSNSAVTAAGQITLASKTAATSASSATTVATGSLKSNDTSGATVMTGLGTATTASAVTSIGTGTAAGQTVTAGTNDLVTALDSSTSVTVS